MRMIDENDEIMGEIEQYKGYIRGNFNFYHFNTGIKCMLRLISNENFKNIIDTLKYSQDYQNQTKFIKQYIFSEFYFIILPKYLTTDQINQLSIKQIEIIHNNQFQDIPMQLLEEQIDKNGIQYVCFDQQQLQEFWKINNSTYFIQPLGKLIPFCIHKFYDLNERNIILTRIKQFKQQRNIEIHSKFNSDKRYISLFSFCINKEEYAKQIVQELIFNYPYIKLKGTFKHNKQQYDFKLFDELCFKEDEVLKDNSDQQSINQFKRILGIQELYKDFMIKNQQINKSLERIDGIIFIDGKFIDSDEIYTIFPYQLCIQILLNKRQNFEIQEGWRREDNKITFSQYINLLNYNLTNQEVNIVKQSELFQQQRDYEVDDTLQQLQQILNQLKSFILITKNLKQVQKLLRQYDHIQLSNLLLGYDIVDQQINLYQYN